MRSVWVGSLKNGRLCVCNTRFLARAWTHSATVFLSVDVIGFTSCFSSGVVHHIFASRKMFTPPTTQPTFPHSAPNLRAFRPPSASLLHITS